MTNVEVDVEDERAALKANHELNVADGEDAVPLTKDPLAVKYVNGSSKTDDVFVDLQGSDELKKHKEAEFVGLKKDELEKFASDPYWVRMRIILLVIFGIVWVAMLVAAVVIIVVAPKCPPRPSQEWWETAVIYQLNPSSFLDTNGDGRGDIKGIQNKLKYLRDTLEVTALNLGPMYHSPRLNFGYDVMDYKSVCHSFGTEADFDSLRVSIHKEGMKLILDFIPNHTSRKHKWFVASRNQSLSDKGFSDFYVWQQGLNGENGIRQPPNNWLNAYGQSAWTFDEARGEYYYHSYTKDEPDLNLTNPKVVGLIDEALLFWLGKHVDGFRFIGVEHLFEPTDLKKNNTEIQPESYNLITHWRELLDNYSTNPDLPKSRRFPRLMIVDVDQSANISAEFFEYKGRPGAHLPTNKVLKSIDKSCKTDCIYSLLKEWSEVIESKRQIANWQVGNYETSRVATRMGNSDSYVNAINLLLLTLPGATMIYNGDELGMKDVVLDPSMNYTISQDLLPRAGQHSPMQWSDKLNAGFTSGKPWLPLANDYKEINVEAQTAHGSGMSHIKVFNSLVKLKQEPSFQWGLFKVNIDKSVLFYVCQAEGFPGFLVAINFGPQISTVNFKDSTITDLLPDEAEVVASTHNFGSVERSENYKEKTSLKLGSVVYLKPTEGIVLKWEPEVSFL